MFDVGVTMSFRAVNCPIAPSGNLNKDKSLYKARTSLPVVVLSSSLVVQTDESKNLAKFKKISGLVRCQSSKSLLNKANTVGIIGGVSVSSTLGFLEKLVRWSSRDAEECLPFVVCCDPPLNKELFNSLKSRSTRIKLNHNPIVENLLHRRSFVEQSGARCIVMPCYVSHAWHGEISEGCSIPFLHVGECVAKELKEAKLKPLEAGSGVRIGVLATDATLSAGIYQEKLQNQGFEVVLPDVATMEHILIPIIESMNRGDMEGARNLLRIAIYLLLVRAVNAIIFASEEVQGLLPDNDPLLKKCIDPMDALARSTIKWARSNKVVH